MGDTIEIEEGTRLLWSIIPHLIWEPGNLYSYSYGLLTAWSAVARFTQVGDGFAEGYLAMLAAGGSRSPEELVAMLGLQVTIGFLEHGPGPARRNAERGRSARRTISAPLAKRKQYEVERPWQAGLSLPCRAFGPGSSLLSAR